jgi:hypothetical protein
MLKAKPDLKQFTNGQRSWNASRKEHELKYQKIKSIKVAAEKKTFELADWIIAALSESWRKKKLARMTPHILHNEVANKFSSKRSHTTRWMEGEIKEKRKRWKKVVAMTETSPFASFFSLGFQFKCDYHQNTIHHVELGRWISVDLKTHSRCIEKKLLRM